MADTKVAAGGFRGFQYQDITSTAQLQFSLTYQTT
jgi:hypothetical protein